MDDFKVLALIADGEGNKTDFKRELDLNSADSKAEFIKDVVSLANTAVPNGFLLIGIDDNKYIVGTNKMEETRIQQIASTYIDPPVTIRCFLVPITTSSGLPSVGVIEVFGNKRPHKVTRAIGNLNQNDVFVRRGSIILKASPEEIIDMHYKTQNRDDLPRYISTAATHIKAGNYMSAITMYSKAIEETPTFDLFLARGEANAFALEQLEDSLGRKKQWNLPEDKLRTYLEKKIYFAKNAINDFESAVRLSDSIDAERMARLKRFTFGCSRYGDAHYSWEQKDQDFQWLRDNLDGKELGRVICLYVDTWDLQGNDWSVGEDAVSLMDEAIQLGYDESRAFYLRATGHIVAGNYGLALKDTDKALMSVDQKNKEQVVELLCYRAQALCETKRYSEAHESLLKAREIDEDSLYGHIMLAYDIDSKILYECGLNHEFNGPNDSLGLPMRTIVKILILWRGRTKFMTADGEQLSELDYLEKKCPGVVQYLKKILGQELWQTMNTKKDLAISIELPSLLH